MKFNPPDGYEVATKKNATGAHGVPRTVVYHGSDGVWHAMHTAKDGTVTHYPKDYAPHEVLAKFVFMFDGLLSGIKQQRRRITWYIFHRVRNFFTSATTCFHA